VKEILWDSDGTRTSEATKFSMWNVGKAALAFMAREAMMTVIERVLSMAANGS
jgi:hypothetical protein